MSDVKIDLNIDLIDNSVSLYINDSLFAEWLSADGEPMSVSEMVTRAFKEGMGYQILNGKERTLILTEVLKERARQDEKWGGPDHDDHHSIDDWVRFICNHASNSEYYAEYPDQGSSREELIETTALCLASLESIDRKKT